MKKVSLALAYALILTGCSSVTRYTPPVVETPVSNSVKVLGGKDEVWSRLVPNLGKQFFVINNMDKESGLINVSYSGEPSRYVDCGNAVISVTGREQHVDGDAKNAQYRIQRGIHFFEVKRQMNLEGRVNIILEEVDNNTTQVTANTKYILNISITELPANGGIYRSGSDSISFNTGETGKLDSEGGEQILCVSTGTLEKEILSLIE